MTHSESIKNLMVAIQNVQQNVPVIKRASKGQVGTRSYKYADINDVWDTIKPELKKNMLTILQSPEQTSFGQLFTTLIFHTDSEEWIESSMPLVLQRDDPQGMGSSITYFRRYMVMSMLGLTSDEYDSDASEHRLATAEQKARIVGAVKLAFPGIDKGKIVPAIQDIVGKHPSMIRSEEVDNVIGLIKAFVED